MYHHPLPTESFSSLWLDCLPKLHSPNGIIRHKKRRLSSHSPQDLKHDIAVRRVQAKMGTNPSQIVRTGDIDAGVSSGRFWALQHVLRCQAANFKIFNCPLFLFIGVDGCRFGQPKEKTNTYFFWEAVSDYATWGLQALSVIYLAVRLASFLNQANNQERQPHQSVHHVHVTPLCRGY